MNDRLATAVGALVSLLLLLALLYTPARSLPVSFPNTESDGANGYLALKRWLDGSGIRTVSLRRRFSSLEDAVDLSARGNVLLTTMPYRTSLRDEQGEHLQRWVRNGNTILVLAALNDSPDWILAIDTSRFILELNQVSGLYFYAAEDDEGNTLQLGELATESVLELEPLPAHPLMERVESLAGESDSLASIWLPYLETAPGFVAVMATESTSGKPAFWHLPAGDGSIFVSSSGSMLANRAIGSADNAEFFAELLAWHLGPGGAVIFDDYHQGLSELYDPDAFFADDRTHASLGFILLFWLVYLLGTSDRLRRVEEVREPPRQADLVHSVGGFMTRKLERRDAGRLLVDEWFLQLQREGRIQPGPASPWEQLAAMPLVPAPLLDRLRRDYVRLGLGKRVNLRNMHNLILELKRKLQ